MPPKPPGLTDMEDQQWELAHHTTLGHSNADLHWCAEWDGLLVCRDCPEAECCQCDLEEPT